MKKLIAVFLLAALSLLAACDMPGGSGKETASPTAGDSAKITIEVEKYALIFPEDSPSGTSGAAMGLYNYIKEAFGVSPSVSNDSSPPQEFEILIGATNRTPHLSDEIKEDEYLVTFENFRLAAYGKNAVTVATATEYLKENILKKNAEGAVIIEKTLYIKNKIELPQEKEYKNMDIKIATYNIGNGEYVKYDYKKIAKDITDSGAEIVALQEIDQLTTRNGMRDTMKLLSEYTGYKYYSFVPTLTAYKGGQYGIAVLSKYPIKSTAQIKLPKTTSNEEQRCAMLAVIDLGETTLDFYVTHIQQVSFDIQMSAINDFIKQNSTGNFLLAGDFNYQVFEKFKIIENSHIINNDFTKLVTTVNNQMFDNIVLAKAIEAKGIERVITENSDHHLLKCVITIKYE